MLLQLVDRVPGKTGSALDSFIEEALRQRLPLPRVRSPNQLRWPLGSAENRVASPSDLPS